MINPRWWLSLLGLGLLAACEQRPPAATLETSGPTVATVPPAKAKLPPSDSAQARTQALLALYRTYPLPLELSTKKLYHDTLGTDTVDTGVLIPDRLLKLFGKRIRHVKGEEDVFALAQIPLANGSIGLATRALNSNPDGRAPYKVQLFVFDPRQQRIVTSCHIGEYITGMSTAFIREATIRQQPGQSLFINIKQRITTILSDPGRENTGSTSVSRTDSLLVCRLQNNRFEIVSRKELDSSYGHLGTMEEDDE